MGHGYENEKIENDHTTTKIKTGQKSWQKPKRINEVTKKNEAMISLRQKKESFRNYHLLSNATNHQFHFGKKKNDLISWKRNDWTEENSYISFHLLFFIFLIIILFLF